MKYGVLFGLMLAHVLSDFVFQGTSIFMLRCNEEFRKRVRGTLIHISICFFISLLCTIYYFSFYYIWGLLLLAIIHGLIDICKSSIISRNSTYENNIFLFLVDQLLHVLAIFIMSRSISEYIPKISLVSQTINGISDFTRSCFPGTISRQEKWIIFLFLMCWGLWGAGVFIKIFFKQLNSKRGKGATIDTPIYIGASQDEGISNGGFIIGILERLFIICAVIVNLSSVIGFVLAAKSIARFKKFDEDDFVEVFIIGTLISTLTAIIIGVLIRSLGLFPQWIQIKE